MMLSNNRKSRKGQRGLFAFFLFIMVLLTNIIFASTVVGTGRVENRGGELLIVFPLNQQIKFNSFRLQNPDRLVIDIPNAALQRKVTSIPVSLLI